MKEPLQIDNLNQIKHAFEKPQWYLKGTAFNIKLRAETIEEFSNGRKYQSILDIGCGDGSLSLPLFNGGNRLTFLDQSQAMLNIVRSRVPAEFSHHVRTINADFMEVELIPQSFDLIICVGVLAYVKKRRDFILKIKSLLKPGGLVIIECTDARHFLSYWVRAYQRLVNFIRPARLETVIGSSSDILAIFSDFDFQCCGSYRYSMPPPPLNKILSQKFSYRVVRSINGTVKNNRNAWLGRECIYFYEGGKELMAHSS